MNNRTQYETPHVVGYYAGVDHLYWPEAHVLNLFAEDWAETRMLDLGVGGGRTTLHFAPRVQAYVGADYAENMIDACRTRFPLLGAHASFRVADVRDLSCFEDNAFDFVLFSFNGLDYIGHEDRLRALAEIRRVTAPGGRFLFSTHNLNAADTLLKIRWTANPAKLLRRLARRRRLLERNPVLADLNGRDWALINDPAHDFAFHHYYVKPTVAAAQACDAGFGTIRAFSHREQRALPADEWAVTTDPWPYFLCESGNANPDAPGD